MPGCRHHKTVLRIEHPAGHGGNFLQLVLHDAGIERRFITGDDDKRRAGGATSLYRRIRDP